MVRVRIMCHADIQALRKRSDQLLSIELVSVDSVRTASDSCKLLLNLIQGPTDYPIEVNIAERRYWSCDQLVLLSLIAGVALELHKIKHDLYPLLVSPEANLEGGFLKHLLFLRNSALALVRLAKKAKEIVQGLDQKVVIDGPLLGRVKKFGQVVEDTADPVLKGTHDIAWFQARLPSVLDLPLDLLLLTPVHFPNPHKYASSDSDSDSDSE